MSAELKAISSERSSNKVAFRHRESRLAIPLEVESKVILTSSESTYADLKLMDISTFGLRVAFANQHTAFLIGQSFQATVSILGQIVYEGPVEVTNELPMIHAQVSYGLSISERPIDIDMVRALIGDLEMRPKLAGTKSILSIAPQVRPEFKMLVADLNTFFQDLKSKLDLEEKVIKESSLNANHRRRLEQHAISLAVSLYSHDMFVLFQKFQEVVDSFSEEENQTHKHYFRANFSHLVKATPFLRRAFEKPLGYAGDFGLMNMFYNYDDLGETLFDKFNHRASCNQPVAIANKNRIEVLAKLVRESFQASKSDLFKISSIACGPAQEISVFLSDLNSDKNRKISVNLVDHEPLALDHAVNTVRTVGLTKCKLTVNAFKEDAVMGLIKSKPFVDELKSSDVLICAGLFDYLSERVGAKLVEAMIPLLSDDGCLIVGNVSDQNPNRFSMDYFMDWNLVLRGKSDLLKLFPKEYQDDSSLSREVLSESLGINLFLKIKRNGR